jgi:hypothetical protein
MLVGIGFVAVVTAALAQRFLAEELTKAQETAEKIADVRRELRAIRSVSASLNRQFGPSRR